MLQTDLFALIGFVAFVCFCVIGGVFWIIKPKEKQQKVAIIWVSVLVSIFVLIGLLWATY